MQPDDQECACRPQSSSPPLSNPDVVRLLRGAAARSDLEFRYFIAWTADQDDRRVTRRFVAKNRYRSLRCALLESFRLKADCEDEQSVLELEVGVFLTEDGRFIKAMIPVAPTNVLEFGSAQGITPVPSFSTLDELAVYIVDFGGVRVVSSSGVEQ